jgi:hypothetical protein
MVQVFSYINVKFTKRTFFCTKNIVKTHENTSKTMHFSCYMMYDTEFKIFHVIILQGIKLLEFVGIR